ncbi:hypothetical protein AN642_00060 [Epulopiscium sp. SCG-B10WGA-EpuloA2]|nr:hypothetical protein AN641_08585 [Epulopiscium sp. SCG-C07WGA-EpuloA2]ONI46979.1 hypothetical protein AN642_00060 [Epulopiscium sp. SCG-B10WGA-EpuloA2]
MNEFNTKIEELQLEYPDGTEQYEFSYNGLVLGWECHGLARFLTGEIYDVESKNGHNEGYEIFGATATDSQIENLSIGDMVRYRNSDVTDHTIFITDINENTITYVDNNRDHDNKIYWNQTMTFEMLDEKLKKELFWYSTTSPNGYGAIINYKPLEGDEVDIVLDFN